LLSSCSCALIFGLIRSFPSGNDRLEMSHDRDAPRFVNFRSTDASLRSAMTLPGTSIG
jgi:hypothetical protein